MEIREYWRAFRRRLWIPLLLAVAAMVTAGVVAQFSKPTYSAATTVLVKSGSVSVERAVSFPQTAASNTVALGVIKTLGLNESVDQLVNQVRTVFAGGNLYRVTVTDGNPQRAGAIANEVGRQAALLYVELNVKTSNAAADQALLKARDDLAQRYAAAASTRLRFQQQHPGVLTPNGSIKDVSASAQVLQLQLEEDAAASAYRNILDQLNRNLLVQLAATTGLEARVLDQAVARLDTGSLIFQVLSAGALALVLGTLLVFLLEYLDNSVREPEAAEEMVGAPVIGVIPRANPHSLRAIQGGV
jgi:capsular polysaccharide biosynthesis protein